MKIIRKDTSKTTVELTITLSGSELASAQQVALVRLGKELKTPGFRKGKVPAAIVKKQVGADELNSQTLSDAVNGAIPKAFTSEKLQPLQRPEVEVKKYVPGQELAFTAECEIVPPVTLGDYKKLTITKPKIIVSGKDIDEVVARMQAGFAEKKEVKRPAKNGDEVVMDFTGLDVKGVAFAGGSGKDYALTLGSDTFIPGFEEGLVGKKAGDSFDLPITFPKDYHAAHLAGTAVSFKISVKTVKQVILPKLDNAFAKKCGSFETLSDLRKDIKNEITRQRESEAQEEIKNQLVEQLVRSAQPAAPESLVQDQMKNIETDFVQNLKARGMSLEQYLKQKNWSYQEWQQKDLHVAAQRRIESALVLSELSKLEKIEVSQDEIQARHEEMLRQYTDPNMRLQLETPEAKNDLGNRIMTEKTLERLIKLNTK